MKKSILVALTAALALAFGVSTYAADTKPAADKAAAPAAEKKADAKPAAEKTVKGTVEKGKADGSWVIKAGKKTYDVDAASPKAADVAGLAGKKVEAKGVVTKNVISVTDIKEAAAKAEKKVAKAEKPAEKPAEKK